MEQEIKTKEEVFETIEKRAVKSIGLAAFDEGMGFNGSSIKGFARMDESDMFAKTEPGLEKRKKIEAA
jgi:glutamine synthetase